MDAASPAPEQLGPELESLRLEAEAELLRSPGAAPGELAPARRDTAAEWRGAIELALGMLKPAYPRLADVYTEKVIEELAERVDAVALKYNITAWQWFEKYKEEISLVLFAFPLLKSTAAAMRTKPEAAAPAPAPAVGVPLYPPPAGALKPNA